MSWLSRGGWSWKRFVGIPQLKRRAMRSVGLGWMPLTKQGWQRKVGRSVLQAIGIEKKR